MMTYAQKLKQSISSIQTDPNKDKKFARRSILPKCSLDFVYDQNDFPELPSAKSQATSKFASHTNQSSSTASSFSSDGLTSEVTNSDTQLSQAIDLPALTKEIKKNLLNEFNTILQQELAALHAELLSSLSQAYSPCNNSDQLKLSAQSSLESDVHDTLNKKIDDLQLKFEESLDSTLSMCKWLENNSAQMREYIDLLHQQILTCHQQIALFQKPPKGKRGS